jgi:hypothetical protein
MLNDSDLSYQQKLASLICDCTHPIYLTQCLMGNVPNYDLDASLLLSGILGVVWEKGGDIAYGPFVPNVLQQPNISY